MSNEHEHLLMLTTALNDLCCAVKRMTLRTEPQTPLPRPRLFHITKESHWPHVMPEDGVKWLEIDQGNDWTRSIKTNYNSGYAAKSILKACKWQPRLILRSLRQIQAATAWCEARAEGRQRAAQEILRQQAAAVEALEAEAAMLALK